MVGLFNAGGVVFMIGVGIGLVVDILVGLPERDYHGAVAADVIQIWRAFVLSECRNMARNCVE